MHWLFIWLRIPPRIEYGIIATAMTPTKSVIQGQLKRNLSPLRYPGGKRNFVPLLTKIIEANNLQGINYIEPYAGGAGAALELLKSEVVSSIHLNDKDRAIYWIWKAALEHTDKFIEKIFSIELSVTEWQAQRSALFSNKSGFDLGFAAFYLNRTSVSGVIKRSGPIGGYNQTGNYLINCRFNRDVLAAKIAYIGANKRKIKITNQDSIKLLTKNINDKHSTLTYLDPPYYHKASELYLNAYQHSDHQQLRDFLFDEYNDHFWILSYDLCPEILKLYEHHKMLDVRTHHSLANKGNKNEYITVSDKMDFPCV